MNPIAGRQAAVAALGLTVLGLAVCGIMLWPRLSQPTQPLAPSAPAAALDGRLDWSRARLIAVQDQQRYKTLDSFAREWVAGMYGKDRLPGLSPLASLCEILFNVRAYIDEPVVYLKDLPLRAEFTTRLDEAARKRVRKTGRMTPREFFAADVQARISQLEPRTELTNAIQRARRAGFTASALPEFLALVPTGEPRMDVAWSAPGRLRANLSDEQLQQRSLTRQQVLGEVGQPVKGVSADEAARVLGIWEALGDGWRAGAADQVQAGLDELAAALPQLAHGGFYPPQSQLAAEQRYYAAGKFGWAWTIYLLGTLLSVLALVTGFRAPFRAALVVTLVALLLHAYGIRLRWLIIDHIPVANMFEAITWAAWFAIAVAVVVELCYPRRIFLLAANAAGFLGLVVAHFVLPGGGDITSIRGILDDVMLRIHTVLIIWSYGLIFIAAVIAAAYLFVYYARISVALSALGGVAAVLAGVLCAAYPFWLAAGGAPLGTWGFLLNCGYVLIGCGILWVYACALYAMQHGAAPAAHGALGGGGAVALAGGGMLTRLDRPIMAGYAPGDEGRRDIPEWLHAWDWCHLIILNMSFVMLFVGIILGAIWADYSWGRPWGWDAKEVFAMNTWLIYAILIHARFVASNKGVWTAWLSVAGCGMMAFNWAFVNFYIVGLHSYA